MDFSIGSILHQIGQVALIPCMVILGLFLIVGLLHTAGVIVEYFVERRKSKENISELIAKISHTDMTLIDKLINDSKLVPRQKRAAMKLVDSKDMPHNSLITMAQTILSEEEAFYERNTMITDIVAKLAPMFGLLGTLIPLGPGIVGLGKGDTALLSASMGTAFDSTIIGLLAASFCFVISNIRKRWYAKYMSELESIMECILEGVKPNA